MRRSGWPRRHGNGCVYSPWRESTFFTQRFLYPFDERGVLPCIQKEKGHEKTERCSEANEDAALDEFFSCHIVSLFLRHTNHTSNGCLRPARAGCLSDCVSWSLFQVTRSSSVSAFQGGTMLWI